MESTYYQIYIDATMQLAMSLVVKSSDTATAVNNLLYISEGPNSYDPEHPETWRYYLNLAGEYHPSDEVMTVVSMDTLQMIEFSKENLQHHRATAKAYTYGSQHYLELVQRYPEQERLILGILYPADLQTAVNSQDGTILSYPPHLVEQWEYSLISRLQQWIYGYMARWDNRQYKLSDNLYATTMLGIMFVNLPPTILNLRLEVCKTNEAHSYHIRQYLASHGLLDQYLPYMTRKQALFLYRNIAYIERNSGKQAVFEWLMEHIMTQRGLPLAEFRMQHDLSEQPTQLKPQLTFNKRPLNTDLNHDLRDFFTLGEVLDKEDPLARDNAKYRDEEQASAALQMGYSLSNELQTKLLESSVTDYADSEHYTLADTLLSEWMHLTSDDVGLYHAFVSFKSPLTDETIILSAKDAFVFYFWLTCKSIGTTLETLPIVRTKRSMIVPKVPLSTIMSVVNPKKVTTAFAQRMLNLLPVPQVMISVDSFYQYCKEVHYAALQQYYNVCLDGRRDARAQKFNLISRCWADFDIQLGEEGQTFDAWFAERNIKVSDFRPTDYSVLAEFIMNAALGLDSTKAITLKDIQQAMVKIMAQLGSYSVHYTASINAGPLMDSPSSTMRPDDWEGMYQQSYELNMVNGIVDVSTKYKPSYKYDIGSDAFELDYQQRTQVGMKYELNVEPWFDKNTLIFQHELLRPVGVSWDLPPLPDNPRNVTPVIGIQIYLNLSPENQAKIPDLWTM